MPFRQYVVKPNSAADARFTTTPTFDSAYFTVENNSTQMDGGMYQDTGGGGLPMSYHHQRAASLESLESSATSQTRYSSDSGGDGTSYSREGSHPRDGISRGGSAGNYHGLRRASLSTTAPAHSPMQFVKTDISPLAIKAAMHVQKMKKFEEEKKKAKEIEPWQGDTYLQDLSNWRDKRRKQSVTNPTESSDHDQTDASDQEQPKEQPKTKTFSEIMKERKSRRHSYNFYPIDDSASTIVDVDIESNAQDKPAVITNSNDDRDRNQRTIRKKDETDCGVTKETDPEIIELLKRVAAMKAQQLRNKGSESESESEDSETGEVQKQNEKNEKVATITKTDSLTPPRRTSVGSTGRRRSSSEAPYIINPNRNLPGLQRQFSGKYEDKEIQLKQNPHKSDGFGFTIKGGIDQLLPILVDNIIEGSTADDADICEGDELLYVNGQTCENQFKGSVMLVINSAVKAGQLNIKLRRFENARKKSSTTVPPILPPTQAQIETLYETAGPRRKNKPDSVSDDDDDFDKGEDDNLTRSVFIPTKRVPPSVPPKPSLKSSLSLHAITESPDLEQKLNIERLKSDEAEPSAQKSTRPTDDEEFNYSMLHGDPSHLGFNSSNQQHGKQHAFETNLPDLLPKNAYTLNSTTAEIIMPTSMPTTLAPAPTAPASAMDRGDKVDVGGSMSSDEEERLEREIMDKLELEENLEEETGMMSDYEEDETLKTPLQRARRSLSLDSGRSTPPAPIMETLPDINEAPSPSPAGKTKPKLQAFSFLEKFAAEEEKEGRANEKPKMRQSSALPFLDKYLKSQDKFEQLANLEDDATDDKQKTFTFLDTLQNSTPPPDLSATTKPKPYKSDSPTVNGDTAVVKPDTTKPEAPATVGKLDEQALWARVESQMSAAPMGRKKRLSQHEDLNTSSASSTGSVDKKLEKQWKSVENNNAQSENNAETTKKSLFQPKYKPVEFKKAVKSPEPTSAKPPIAKQKQSDNNNVIKKAAVAKDAAKPNIKQSPTTKQNGSSPSKRINGGALSPSTVQSGPKRNGKPSVLNRWDPASLQEEKRKREQWIKDQEKRHKELLEKEQALHKSEEEEQEEADRSHRQIKDVEDSKLLLLKTGAAPDVVIRSTEQHKIESTYNRKQDDEDAQLEYPRDEDEKKRQLDYERRRRIDEQKRKLEIDIAETKQKMADDRRSRDRKNRQLSEDQQRQVWIEEQEIEQEERELELLRREEERKLKEWEERMKRDAEQRKNEPRRDIHYQDRRTAQEPRNNDGRGGYYQDHGNGRTQPESVILRTSRNGPSYSMPTKTRPDSVPNHAQVSRQPVPNHPQHRRPESLPVHYQLVRESNSPNLSGKNNYHDTKKPLVSPKGIMKQSSSPPRSPLVSRRMDSPGKELVDGVLNSPQFAKRGHTSPNMRSKSAERLNSKPFIENSLQKQQQQQQQYRPGFNNSRSMHNLRVDSPSSQTRYDNSKTPHGEAMHREIQNPQQHWLFEEAERRRIDEQRYKEQQLKYAQQQQQPTHRNESRNHPRNARNDSRRYDERLSPNKDPSLRNHSPNKDLGYRPAHMEQSTKPVNTVKEYDMPPKKPVHYSGPIPDAIKQTLLQRVSSPKSPNPPDYADYSQYPQYSAGYSPKPQHNPSYSQPGQYNPSYNTHPGPKSYQNVPHSVDGLVRMSSPHVANRSSPYSGNSAADLRGSAKGPPKPPRNVPGGAEVEQVLAVSGQHRCCHCNQELGHGAAMVIESLQLYYHMQCFRCVVCHTPLSYGHNGADVRVRASRLHCVNCYSNDEGIKYSKV
ncbi:uncharacterized protein LOC141905900 isoform X2 [Tubulanus polymorphus]|uniref:uncharacterized protein LOC141905900 isoform X2 n=1 Tax=Tubulanus polymorphus TaxID=672921 RepID=UPI003DA1E70D